MSTRNSTITTPTSTTGWTAACPTSTDPSLPSQHASGCSDPVNEGLDRTVGERDAFPTEHVGDMHLALMRMLADRCCNVFLVPVQPAPRQSRARQGFRRRGGPFATI